MVNSQRGVCFLLIIISFVSGKIEDIAEEPRCSSKFDYDYKLMHLVVNLERQLSDLTATTDRLKSELSDLDTTYKDKIADIQLKLTTETANSELLKSKVQELTGQLNGLINKVDKVPSWSSWTEWSACFMNCTGPSGGRQQTRTRTDSDSNTDENESRPCNAVQFAGCVKTTDNNNDEYAVVYDYQDMIAQATCSALDSGYLRAIRRNCGGQLSCASVCGEVGTTCFNSLHVYGGQPVPDRGVYGAKGPKVYKYDSCGGVFCGPNYCCCKGS